MARETAISCVYVLVCRFKCVETQSLYVVLAGLEFTDIFLSLPPKSIRHHTLLCVCVCSKVNEWKDFLLVGGKDFRTLVIRLGIKANKKTLDSVNHVKVKNLQNLERIKTAENCHGLHLQECSGQLLAGGNCKGSRRSSTSEASLDAGFRKRVTFARLSLINSLKGGQPCLAWHRPLAYLLLLPDLWFAQRGSLGCPGPRRVTPTGEPCLLTVLMGAQGTRHLWPQTDLKG